MGGAGSGRWFRFDRKLTVEESLSFSLRDFRSLINSSATGTVNWTGVCGQACSIAFVLELGDVPTITLHYLWQNSVEVQIPVRLHSTKRHRMNLKNPILSQKSPHQTSDRT